MKEIMKVALVGCGIFGKEHIMALRELDRVRVVGVCDQDFERAVSLAELTKEAQPYQNLEKLLSQEKPMVVHILTPPETHFRLSVQAMQAGCHVLVEKPMALTTAEANSMIESAKANGVKLATDHNYLFNPCILRARQFVQQGQIGQVVYVNGFYGMPGAASDYRSVSGRSHWAWRLPGNVFTNFYPHMIYLAESFLPGDLSVSGVTLGREQGGESFPTELNVLLDGENASATLLISMRIQPYAKYIDIYGEKGIIHADLANEICTFHKVPRVPGMVAKVLFNLEESAQLAAGTVLNTTKVVLGQMRNNPGLRYHLREFYNAIGNGKDLPVTGEDGKRMIAIMEATWKNMPSSVSNPVAYSMSKRTTNPKTETEKKINENGFSGKALVTGATGYLGYYLIEALARSGLDVRAFVHDRSRVSKEIEERAEIVCGDIRDLSSLEDAMQGVTVVYHCAAATRNFLSRKVHVETNVQGTENVLKAALKTGVSRVVHMSSVIVYGLSDGSVDENSPYSTESDPYANYMHTKIDADRLAINFHRDFGLPITVLRLGSLYGPASGRQFNRGLVQIGFLKFYIGSGQNHNPNLFIRNAVDAILLASFSSQAIGQVYNIVDEPQIKGRDFYNKCEQISGERCVRIPIPEFLIRFGSQILEWQVAKNGKNTPPKLSKFVVRSACRDIYYSTVKIREQLGWTPPVTLDDGLKETMEI